MKALALIAVAAVVALAGCAAPAPGGAAGRPPAAVVYVANGADGTITRLDGATGRALGPPLPGGRLLVLSRGAGSALTHVAPGGRGWMARPVPLGAYATGALLAGDGGGRAALAYRVAATPARPAVPCRVVLLDVATGAIQATHAPCGPHEVIVGLAFDDGPAAPTVYLGIWRLATWGDVAPAPAGGRMRALNAATGAVVAVVPLGGVPGQLVLSAALGGAGRRLYCVEGRDGAGGPSGAAEAGDYTRASTWVVIGLDPLTLEPESAVVLGAVPRSLAVTGDGNHAYAVAARGSRTSSSELVHIDLRRGDVRPLGSVPGSGNAGLALAGDRVYVPDPEGSRVAVIDRRSGRPLPTVGAGRGPIGITVAGRTG